MRHVEKTWDQIPAEPLGSDAGPVTTSFELVRRCSAHSSNTLGMYEELGTLCHTMPVQSLAHSLAHHRDSRQDTAFVLNCRKTCKKMQIPVASLSRQLLGNSY